LDLTAKIGEQDRANVQVASPSSALRCSAGTRVLSEGKSVEACRVRGIFSNKYRTAHSMCRSSLPTQDVKVRSGLTAQIVFLGANKQKVLYCALACLR